MYWNKTTTYTGLLVEPDTRPLSLHTAELARKVLARLQAEVHRF